MVVFPAQSNPIIRILTSLLWKSFLNSPVLLASALPELPIQLLSFAPIQSLPDSIVIVCANAVWQVWVGFMFKQLTIQ